MKQRGIILSLLLMVSVASAESIQTVRELSSTAIMAVQEYFHISGRVVNKVEIQGMSRLNGNALDYLVELGAHAQSASGQRMINYHCGVFLKKIRGEWHNQHTECGPLDHYTGYRN